MKTAGVDNIPAEPVKNGGGVRDRATNKILQQDLADRWMANTVDPVTDYNTSQKLQSPAVQKLGNYQFDKPC